MLIANHVKMTSLVFRRKLFFSVDFISFRRISVYNKPKASEVLTNYIRQLNYPPWTSYFVRQFDVKNDQFGLSHFNWKVDDVNYHILRTGCFPYIKYHCTKRSEEDLNLDNKLMAFVKVVTFGVPCLVYGISAFFLIKHKEVVYMNHGNIYIYFLLKENVGSLH